MGRIISVRAAFSVQDDDALAATARAGVDFGTALQSLAKEHEGKIELLEISNSEKYEAPKSLNDEMLPLFREMLDRLPKKDDDFG